MNDKTGSLHAKLAAHQRLAHLSSHVGGTFHLAFPVMLARAGIIIMISVDTAMCGYAGSAQLAHYGIALAPQSFLLVLGIGLLTGTAVLTAQAKGAGRLGDCGSVWHTSLIIAAVGGCLTGGILLLGDSLLLAFGQSPAVAAGGGKALIASAPGMPATLLFLATTFYLEGIGRPRPGMIVALLANLLNAALNWLLIEGQLGAPALGASGAMLATSITRWCMFLALALYVLTMADRHRYGSDLKLAVAPATTVKLLRIGIPLSIAIAFEAGTFGAVTFFAGLLGEIELAGYQAAHNVTTLIFMLAIGLGNATAVRVATAIGRMDQASMAAAGWAGALLVIAMMVGAGLIIGGFDFWIARIYSNDPEVLAVIQAGLGVIALIVVVDGAQAVLVNALRGAGDVLVPTAIYFLAFPGVAIPLSFYLGVEIAGGVPGLLYGLLIGLGLAAGLLGWRFGMICRRPVKPL